MPARKNVSRETAQLQRSHQTEPLPDPEEPLRNAALGELRTQLANSVKNAIYIPRTERFRLSRLDLDDTFLTKEDRQMKIWFDNIYKKSKFRKNNCSAVLGNLEYLVFNHVGTFSEKEGFRKKIDTLRKEIEVQERAILKQEEDLSHARDAEEKSLIEDGIRGTLVGRRESVEELEKLTYEVLALHFFPDDYRKQARTKQPLTDDQIAHVMKKLEDYEPIGDTLIG